MSDTERALIAERILAEQEERRRLAELLHDGPVQHLAAIAHMLDAALAVAREGDVRRTAELVERGLQLTREAAQELRALTDELEPRALRERGLADAAAALARRISARRGVEIDLDLAAASALGEHAQAGVYQLVRDSLEAAVKRGPPDRIAVTLRWLPAGGAELRISDDGPPERRGAVLDALEERAETLNARVTAETPDSGGTVLTVALPPSAAAR
jgi:signal transduction histidine kinase